MLGIHINFNHIHYNLPSETLFTTFGYQGKRHLTPCNSSKLFGYSKKCQGWFLMISLSIMKFEAKMRLVNGGNSGALVLLLLSLIWLIDGDRPVCRSRTCGFRGARAWVGEVGILRDNVVVTSSWIGKNPNKLIMSFFEGLRSELLDSMI